MIPVSSRGAAWTLGALVALAYASVLVGGQTFADLGWLGQVAPARHAAADAIAQGQVPGWWHEAGFGVPLLAEPSHGALYPPAWLASRGAAALDVVAILHLWLLAVGTAALAGRLGADASGRLLAGAAAALSATVAGALVGGVLFSLAWAPLAAERAFALVDATAPDRRRRVHAALAITGCLAAAALAGAPAVAGATIAIVCAIGLSRGGPRGLAWCAAAAVGGLALAAVQIAPALLHAAAGHGAGADATSPGVRMVELLAPGTTGGAGATLGGGAAVVALAALARSRWLAVPAILVAVAAAGGSPPALAWVWLSALAGVALSVLTREPPWRTTRRWATGVLLTLAAAVVALAVARGPIAAAVDRAGLDGAAVVEHAIIRGGVALAFAAAAIALALAAAYRRQPALGALAALVVLGEVVLAGRAAVPRIRRPDRPGLVAALAADAPIRVFRAAAPMRPADRAARDREGPVRSGRGAARDGGGVDAREALESALARAAAASAARHGVAAVPGRDPARLALEDRLVPATAATATRLLDRYALPRAIVPVSVVAATGLRGLARDGNEALVATEPGRPPAFWVTRWRHVSDDDALATLAPPPGQTAGSLGTVLLAGPGDAGGDDLAAPRPCDVSRHGVDEVTMRCEVTAPGYAVLLDAWAPGWSATVDGRGATVERADLVARAVRVPAGARQIVFRYTPPGLLLGAALSALALVNAALLLWLTRRR